MSIHIRDVSDPRLAAFLERIDRSKGGNRDGRISRKETTTAARRIAMDPQWRKLATNTFGAAPESGAELRRFIEHSPKDKALDRILGQSFIAGITEMQAAGPGDWEGLGEIETSRGSKRIAITPGGRITVDGKLPKNLRGLATAVYDAARLAENLPEADLTPAMQRRLFSTLSDAVQVSQSGDRSRSKQRLFAGGMRMLMALARDVDPRSQEGLHSAIMDRILQGLAHEPDPEMRAFYANAMSDLTENLDPVQQAALQAIEELTRPKAPPVDLYTENRTKPLQMTHTIHEEFWEEELTFYDNPQWKLVKKDRKDHERIYEGVMPDPTGKNPPLKTRVVVKKGELDFLSDMSDPEKHVIIYSGHSALGGNGSQSIADAESARGLPKTVMMSVCRGVDNHAEFSNKFPDAMLITTRDPTYSDAGMLRVSTFFDTLARGETFEHMRNRTQVRFWDEAADNYVYPDEPRRMGYMDADEDGKVDRSAFGNDQLFNLDSRQRMGDFTRAISFVNTELFYHWELEHENGLRSAYAKRYYDHVVPDGILKDPKPGEMVRVTKAIKRSPSGREEIFYKVKADPADRSENRDLYAGLVTSHVMMGLAKDKHGELSQFEAMRSVLAGAQGVYYLDVYTNTAKETMQEYLDASGLEGVDVEDVYEVFKNYDTHVNDEQTQAFVDLLQSKYPDVLARWEPPTV